MLAAPLGAMLAVILVLGLIPAIVMGGLYIKRGFADVAIIDKEYEGAETLAVLKPVETFVIDLPEDKERRIRLAKNLQQQVRAARLKHDHGATLLSKNEFALLERQLSLIAAGVDNVDAKGAYNSLVKNIGDQSGLILDPVLDTYYLMTITLNGGREIAQLNQDLADAYAQSSDPRDPLVVLARHALADAARELKDAANTAVKTSKYDFLANSNFLKSVNETITAANRMNSADEMDVLSARIALDKANTKNWEIATYSLKTLLKKRREDTIRQVWISIGISTAAGLLVIIFAAFVIIALADGVRQISFRLHDLSAGDYISAVPGTQYRNDIGVIANALQDFIELSGKVDDERIRAKQELEQTVAHVRKENEILMTEALEQQRKAAEQERETLSRLALDLENKLGTLLSGSRDAAQKMDQEAAAMADRSSEVKREASQAVEVATDICKSVGPVPEAVRTVANSLDEYTISLSEANRLAANAAIKVQSANRRMGEFTQATDKAANMLKLITQVAQKTNMLALNASIEAVRVGEAGKGFEVVANEVKALASSTRDTAAEIAAQIGAMEGANREVADAIYEIMQIVETLAQQSADVADGMNGQSEAIAQVHMVVSSTAAELAKMVVSIEAADDSATATRHRSSEMLLASKGVSENVGALDNSVRAFLRSVHNSQIAA
ncbi:MAG: methyl-accepting chemotaxis protein [Sphingorhabdus sp.]